MLTPSYDDSEHEQQLNWSSASTRCHSSWHASIRSAQWPQKYLSVAAVPEICVNWEQLSSLLYKHNLSLSFPPCDSGDVCRCDAVQLSAHLPPPDPPTLSTPSLCLTGEASHMDWERDWEVLSQPCGDQGEGKGHTNRNTHTHTEYPVLIHSSSPFTETYLVFMTHAAQVDYHCAHHLVEALTATQNKNNKIIVYIIRSLSYEFGCACTFFLSWSQMTIELNVIFHRLGVSLRAGPLQTMCPFWCLCPVMPIHPSSRPPQVAPSGCPRRTRCSGTSSHSQLVSTKYGQSFLVCVMPVHWW